MKRLTQKLMLVLFIMTGTITVLNAQNIDLSTIPFRDTVQLTIYNAEDLTLVRETRQISIKKGQNRLQFSWANTRIDPTSVQLRFLSPSSKHSPQLHLSHTTFPHEKPQMLYWDIESEQEMLSRVEISYFTSGISWSADYTAILNSEWSKMSLDSYVTISNRSGENYDNAEVRLVIGKINLVESVSSLVSQSYEVRDGIAKRKKEKARHMLQRPPGNYAVRAMDEPLAAVAESDQSLYEKEVDKESLSEYTIFRIQGTENIPHRWSKKLRSGSSSDIDIETVYRYRPREYGESLSRILIFKNDSKSSLGESALPAGRIQIYRSGLSDDLHYVAGLNLNYASIEDIVELNTGRDREVLFNTVNLQNRRDNIWLHYKKANILRRVDDGHLRVDHNSRVVGWDEHQLFLQKIRNHSKNPIRVEIRKKVLGDAEIKSSITMSKHDFQTVDLKTKLQPEEKGDFLFEISTKQGKNKKQNGLKIKKHTLKQPDFAVLK